MYGRTKETDHTKVITFAGLPPHESIKLDFSLAVIDSWDKKYTFHCNVNVDANPILQEALFQKIVHSASTLTLEWFAKSYYRHGWSDSQTVTIVNVLVKGIKHAPSIKNIIPDKTIHAYSNYNFTLDANSSSDFDGNILTLNACLDNDSLKASWQSVDPTITMEPSLS